MIVGISRIVFFDVFSGWNKAKATSRHPRHRTTCCVTGAGLSRRLNTVILPMSVTLA
ncbi:hypothetical protein [Thalassospira alkalitolerans]|uniref:hypothetical protein n=1 Tax=Thalassospira alkalitolerans TaxID=1293890 RepID=UPI003C6EE314|tara:strand:- start:9635 stop:9805 length:171 start_codon:yes stop_codon:yes gene_type:complete